MKKTTLLFSLLLVLSLLLAACASATPTPEPVIPTATSTPVVPTATPEPVIPTATTEPIILTDGLGREVTLAAPAQKVVSLSPSNTEILFAIGAGSQVIGRDSFSDFPAEAASVTDIGGSMGAYDTENIVSLQPDLILASELNPADLVKSLEDLGLTVYYLSNPKDFAGLYENLAIVGELTGHSEEVVGLNESLKERVEAVTTQVALSSYMPKVFYELDGTTDATKPWTSGKGTFIDLLISMSGGTNIAGEIDSAWAQISSEEIIAQNPDVILLGDAAYGMTPDQVSARPGWNVIQAVKDGKIYTFDDNLVSRPGPRMVDGLEELARLLQPAYFGE